MGTLFCTIFLSVFVLNCFDFDKANGLKLDDQLKPCVTSKYGCYLINKATNTILLGIDYWDWNFGDDMRFHRYLIVHHGNATKKELYHQGRWKFHKNGTYKQLKIENLGYESSNYLDHYRDYYMTLVTEWRSLKKLYRWSINEKDEIQFYPDLPEKQKQQVICAESQKKGGHYYWNYPVVRIDAADYYNEDECWWIIKPA